MSEGLLTSSDIRRLAAELELKPTKVWGQNFVTDPNTVRSIVKHAGVGPEDDVVEVGPGLGSLTLALLQNCRSTTVIEIDPKLAEQLPKTVAEKLPQVLDKLHVVSQDALKVQTLSVAPSALVANLPYNVSVPVILHLLETFPSIKAVLVMVQAEVADRLAAAPGSRTYGVPSVKARWYGEVKKVATIGRNVFWPAPNVDSALVRIDRYVKPLADVDVVALFAAIDAAFSQRRKMLRSALASWAGSAQRAEHLLISAGIDPTKRGEQLAIEDFVRLTEVSSRHA